MEPFQGFSIGGYHAVYKANQMSEFHEDFTPAVDYFKGISKPSQGISGIAMGLRSTSIDLGGVSGSVMGAFGGIRDLRGVKEDPMVFQGVT